MAASWHLPVEGLAPTRWPGDGLIGSGDRAAEGRREHRGHTRISDPERCAHDPESRSHRPPGRLTAGSGSDPDVVPPGSAHDRGMNAYLLYHRHAPADCATSFAAWNGFHSALRRTSAPSTCAFGGHEIWWSVTAATDREALALLPKYVADRTLTIRCCEVDVP